MKFYQYFLVSTLLTAGMVAYACFTREQFYPIILLLVTSKVSFIIGANMTLAIFILFGKIGVRLFFKELRDAEMEVIQERAKYSVTQTFLALTIFRYELTPSIFLFFGLLFFFKVFQWISRSRLDYLEQVAQVSLYAHSKLLVAILSLLTFSTVISYLCIKYTISEGKTVIVLFAFEFGVLVLSSVKCLVKYIIDVIDGYCENGLHYKGLYFMILDLVIVGLRFCTYVGFFCVIMAFYGLPIHILRYALQFCTVSVSQMVIVDRDVYIAFMSFFMRLTSFIRYLKLTQNLDEKLEDATAEDLAAHEDGGCLICREPIQSGKKLSCGHVFHLNCLRSWLQHQQTCPLCRADIIVSPNSGYGRQHRERAIAAAVAAAERAGARFRDHEPQDDNGNNIRGRGDIQEPHLNFPEAQHGNLRENAPPGNQRRVRSTAGRNSMLPQVSSNTRNSTSSSTLLASMATSSSGPQLQQNSLLDVPGFFVVSHNREVGVLSGPSSCSQPVRVLPPGVVFFVESSMEVVTQNQFQVWLKIADGWILSEDGKSKYVESFTFQDKNYRRRSVTGGVHNERGRLLRILRMQEEMSRLKSSLRVIHNSVTLLSQELAASLQDCELNLQNADYFAPENDETRFSTSNEIDEAVKDSTAHEEKQLDKEILETSFESYSNVDHTTFPRAGVSNNLNSNDTPKKAKENDGHCNFPSTPSHLPSNMTRSPFGHLVGPDRNSAHKSSAKSRTEHRSAHPREINSPDSSPLHRQDQQDKRLQTSFTPESKNDVRELRARRFAGDPSSHKD